MSRLTDYYQCLLKPVAPKTFFVNQIAKLTGKDVGTVRTWVKGRNKPSDPADIRILSDLTGIPVSEIFDESNQND